MATGTILLPLLGGFDATNPPGVETTTSRVRLLFDASTDEIIYKTFRLPQNYASGLTLKIVYGMASATSGAVYFGCQVMAVSDGDSAALDSDSYDTANTGNATVPGTAGYPDEISITLTNADSAAAGDYVALKIFRDADNASDTATGDAEVYALSVEYTTS